MIGADDLSRALAAAQLTDLLPHVDTLARPAIRVTLAAADARGGTIGASRVGGAPDLPPGTLWPTKQGAPLSFVAQIRLEEARPFDAAGLLPAAGLLSFFYDANQETYGTDPADRAGFQVHLYSGDHAGLQRQPFPDALPAAARFHPCGVTFAADLTFAQSPPLELPGLAWTPAQQQAYESAVASVAGQQPQTRTQLLGFPFTLQDDMRAECQLASHGVSMENAATDARSAQLSADANNWQLLLQLDSEPVAGMRWGDAGILYYWIERDALRSGSFDGAWVVLQSD